MTSLSFALGGPGCRMFSYPGGTGTSRRWRMRYVCNMWPWFNILFRVASSARHIQSRPLSPLHRKIILLLRYQLRRILPHHLRYQSLPHLLFLERTLRSHYFPVPTPYTPRAAQTRTLEADHHRPRAPMRPASLERKIA